MVRDRMEEGGHILRPYLQGSRKKELIKGRKAFSRSRKSSEKGQMNMWGPFSTETRPLVGTKALKKTRNKSKSGCLEGFVRERSPTVKHMKKGYAGQVRVKMVGVSLIRAAAMEKVQKGPSKRKWLRKPNREKNRFERKKNRQKYRINGNRQGRSPKDVGDPQRDIT